MAHLKGLSVTPQYAHRHSELQDMELLHAPHEILMDAYFKIISRKGRGLLDSMQLLEPRVEKLP